MKTLETGKLQSEFLEKLLGKISIEDKRVVVGPGIGDDAAVLDMVDHYLIVKSDPITFAVERIGWYAVNINANDIAAMGGKPKWFLVTMLLPEKKTTTALIEEIMHDLRKSCSELGIALVGGHTEITHGLHNPILSGTMIGEVSKKELIHNGNIREGDLLYLTKGVAIEATSIIARERKEEVIRHFGKEFYRRCISFLENPGISVLPDARLITSSLKVAGMHDPTEGGVLTGAYEMARRSGTGLVIQLERIPVYPETRLLCERFGLSPYGAVASGSLLVAVPREGRERIEKAFQDASPGSPALSLIGEFTSKGEPFYVVEGGKKREIHPTGRDEITKLFKG